MTRRTTALLAVGAFLACTVIATVLAGVRPVGAAGVAPWTVRVIGFLCAIGAGVLLLVPDRRSPSGTARADRPTGGVLIVLTLVLVVLDLTGASDADGGADIGLGLVRLLCLVAVVVLAARLALADRRLGRDRP